MRFHVPAREGLVLRVYGLVPEQARRRRERLAADLAHELGLALVGPDVGLDVLVAEVVAANVALHFLKKCQGRRLMFELTKNTRLVFTVVSVLSTL